MIKQLVWAGKLCIRARLYLPYSFVISSTFCLSKRWSQKDTPGRRTFPTHRPARIAGRPELHILWLRLFAPIHCRKSSFNYHLPKAKGYGRFLTHRPTACNPHRLAAGGENLLLYEKMDIIICFAVIDKKGCLALMHEWVEKRKIRCVLLW